jgi:hypothetical protein
MTDRREELRANLHWLSAKSQTFAESLMANPNQSPKVQHWIGELIKQAMAAQNAKSSQNVKSAPAATINLSGIIKMFDHAATHMQNPKMLIRIGDIDFLLNRGKANSRNPGTVYVAEPGDFNSRTRYGRIAPDGNFAPDDRIAPDLMQSIIAALLQINENPAKVAADYGKLTSHCCFCKISLTDPRSVEVGYGPICADHYGLPWG